MSIRLAALQQHVSWLGGLTNHQDAFGPLYRMLLGLHAAAAFIQRDEELCALRAMSLPRTARALLSCGMQPLIGNLLHVVRAYAAASFLTCGMPVIGIMKYLQLT